MAIIQAKLKLELKQSFISIRIMATHPLSKKNDWAHGTTIQYKNIQVWK